MISSREDLLKILDDPEAYKANIKNIKDLFNVLKQFPDDAGIILDPVINNKEIRHQVFARYFMNTIAEISPDHARKLIHICYNDYKEYILFLLPKSYDISFYTLLKNYFPDLHQELLEPIVKNKEVRMKIWRYSDFLKMISEHFPEYAEKLLEPVFTDPEEFKHAFSMSSEIWTVMQCFPHHRDKLIKLVIDNKELRMNIINYDGFVRLAAKEFPEHAEELVEFLYIDREQFKQTFKSLGDIREVVKDFPHHAEKFASILLNDPEEFQRLIGPKDHYGFGELIPEALQELDQEQLKAAAAIFPGHEDVFGKATLEEALHVVKLNSPQAKSFTEGAVMGAFAGTNTPFATSEIAKHLGSLFDRKDANTFLVNKKSDDYAKAEEEKGIHKQRQGYKPKK